jgi:two-component system cell cycle sensor histidine kinase/response regulator CckA
MNRDLLRILHLEANPVDHEAVKRRAAETGLAFTFERATGRAEFETALKRGNIDLVLADHCLPGFDGTAALESARSILPGVPYVVVSKSIGEDRVAECLRQGASDFVHKDRLEKLPSAITRATQGTSPGLPRLDAEERFQMMAENIRDVFWICTADANSVLYVSPAFESIWGSAPGGVLSASGGWMESVLPEDRTAFKEARGKLAAGSAYEIEYRIRRPDSSVRWIHDRGFPAPQGGTGPARTVGVAADITNRKRLEADLLHAQKMEFVGKLAGGIAHDFNNLLTIISGYVSMLLDKDSLPPDSIESLKRVFTASRQATRLVHQLLLFSRKRAPRREPIELNSEVEPMVAMLRRLLGETVSVAFEPSADSPRISADVGMLEQVLMNLAINARDAMPRGGRLSISIDSRPREGSKDDPATRKSGYACLTVRDTGCGIPAAILPRIFEPFFTTKEEGRGTGLGLATAQDIVKRHDGWIEVETVVGTGSAFRIYLPLTSAAVAPPQSQLAGSTPKEGKATILLVEDEGAVREFAAAVLQQDGYTVLQADSGDQAIEVWQWHSARIDLLLTDVVLPGDFSGPQLVAMLRDQKAGLRAVLSTGYGREILDEEPGSANPPLVLSKPYTPRTLLRAVHEALS